MNECSYGTPDIRVGDLVKATHRTHSDETIAGRVCFADRDLVSTATRSITRSYYTFEVLDRPLPEIDEELLVGAIDTFRRERYGTGPDPIPENCPYRRSLAAVINYLRENDTYQKESK
jgi:hypothetical protein